MTFNTIDFCPEDAERPVFLHEMLAREVVHGDIFSIANMDDGELRQAIIQDVLSVTMWEIQMGKVAHFGFSLLTKFIPRFMHKRVRKQMAHDEINGLLMVTRMPTGSEIRIRNNREILQAAMDYCGVYYSGFSMPPGTLVLNRGALEDFISEKGGIDNAAEYIAMEICKTEKEGSTVH